MWISVILNTTCKDLFFHFLGETPSHKVSGGGTYFAGLLMVILQHEFILPWTEKEVVWKLEERFSELSKGSIFCERELTRQDCKPTEEG